MRKNNLPDHDGSLGERRCEYKASINHGVSVVCGWAVAAGLWLDTVRGSVANTDTAAMSQKT